MMEIRIPASRHWESFERLASREGWVMPHWELDLYRRAWPGAAAVLLDDHVPCGFVTAVAFGAHGWIGNLIVDPGCRGRGLGRQLFAHALEILERQACSAVWLTASAAGRPLYERFGFRVVDRVERWSLADAGSLPAGGCLPAGDLADVAAADAAVWGVGRSGLFLALEGGGDVVSSGDTVALLQAGEGMRVLGPWLSPSQCPRENRAVLSQLLARRDRRSSIVADVLASSPVRALFPAAGFDAAGICDLMVLGRGEEIDTESLVSFASLGSLG